MAYPDAHTEADLARSWHDLAERFHCRMTRDAFFEGIVNRYREPHRRYHTLDHVADMLTTIDEHRERIEEYEALAFATWFHDVIYDPMRHDNEERSASLARRAMRRLQVPTSITNRASALIIATREHEPPDRSFDAALFIDADLAVLGADHEQYGSYADAIRAEYSMVADVDYRRGRSDQLAELLKRPHIYYTEHMRNRFETQARTNISNELIRLGT